MLRLKVVLLWLLFWGTYAVVLAFVWFAATRVSIALAIPLVVVGFLGLGFATRNNERFFAKHRQWNDQVWFRWCKRGVVSPVRRLYRRLPSSPRCRVCLVPFGGVGKVLRINPSQKNPNFCRSCLESAPLGVHDMEVGVLFADIRGFTAYSETHSSASVADQLRRFYELADVLVRDDALVELIGDQIMALYLPEFPSLRERTPHVMVEAAKRILTELGSKSSADPLPFGVGIHMGVASVGNVGSGNLKNFTAVGDVVNTAARLQSQAAAGEILVSDVVYAKVAAGYPNAEATSLSLKGKSQPVAAHIVRAEKSG